MKIVITGSLGHISKPLAKELLQKKHSVTIMSSKADRQSEIEALGATAAIGTIEDVDFLSETFKDADVVYCMITWKVKFVGLTFLLTLAKLFRIYSAWKHET